MVFSSITFLFYFLPITLLVYFIVPKKARNFILLVASFLFYFYGEPKYILVLLFSCVFNYYASKLIVKYPKQKKGLLISSLIINFGLLIYFKYFNFLITNLNNTFKLSLDTLNIILPIGISFFTFQATSYLIDVYKGKVKPANNLLDFATYLSLFPQLIAGPIVRYETVAKELKERKCSFSLFSKGLKRFIIGLGKKVLLANTLGLLVTTLNGLSSPTILSHWISAISATMQIYYDFSGYSDMAIGLGLIFGFHFLENFDYPLSASSITTFWRRWHISLSSWFKDYIYIPLGGSRTTKFKAMRNILIVWLTTGLWHGASWNFVTWGLYYGILLIIEKKFLLKTLEKHKLLGHIYTFILVVISFVIFNTNTLGESLTFIKAMFGFKSLEFVNHFTLYYLRSYGILLLISLFFLFPYYKTLIKKVYTNRLNKKIIDILEVIVYISIFILSVAFIVDSSYNPFLYFRF